MSANYTLSVDIGSNVSKFLGGMRQSMKGLLSLGKTARGVDLERELKLEKTQNQISQLNRQMEMNALKMDAMRKKAAELRKVIDTPFTFGTDDQKKALGDIERAMENTQNQIIRKQEEMRSITETGRRLSGKRIGARNTTSELDAAQSAIDRLIAKQNELAISYANLEDKMAQAKVVNPNIGKATADLAQVEQQMRMLQGNTDKSSTEVKRLEKSLKDMGNAGKDSTNRVQSGLSGMKNAAVSAGRGMMAPVQGIGKVIGQATRRILLMGMAYKAVRAASSYLFGALKVNSQFSASLNAIKVNLLTAFQPIFDYILPAINALMSYLAQATGYIASFIASLFGKTYSQAKNSARATYKAVSAMDDYGKATKNAKSEADKATASFDKFNDITPSKASAGVGDIPQGGKATAPNFDAVKAPNIGWMDAVIKKLKPLGDAFKALWEAIRPTLEWIWKELLAPFGEWLIIDFIPNALEWLGEKIKAIGEWMKNNKGVVQNIAAVLLVAAAAFTVASIAVGIFNAVLAVNPIVWIVAAIAALIAVIVLCVKNWDAISAAAQAAWDTMVNAFKNAGEWFKKKVVEPIKKFFSDLWNSVTTWAKNTWNNIVKTFTSAGQWFQSSVISPIANFFKALWNNISTWARNAWNGVVSAFQSAGSWFQSRVVQPVANFFKGLWDNLKSGAKQAWEWVSAPFKSAADWFNNTIVKPISNFFGGLWNGIKSGASTLADWIRRYCIDPIVNLFKGMYNSVVSIIEGVINAFIGIINGFIKGINWVINTINNIPGVNIRQLGTMRQVRVPRLAKGGLAYGEIAAIVGDNPNARQDPEVISPLSDLQQMITAAVLQRDMAGGGAGSIEIKMVTEDGTTLAHVLVDPMNKVAKNRGYAPVWKPVSVG